MTTTILVLAANPKGTPPLRLNQELRDIKNALQKAIHRDDFILKMELAARPADVHHAMLNWNPTIVHFCGHGSGEEGITLEDDKGQASLVNAATLSSFFELFADKLECVLLNACFTAIQAEAIAKHIPYVIGMKKAIGDTAAINFAVAFYEALGAGRSIEFAYEFACRANQWVSYAVPSTPVVEINSHAIAEAQPKNVSEQISGGGPQPAIFGAAEIKGGFSIALYRGPKNAIPKRVFQPTAVDKVLLLELIAKLFDLDDLKILCARMEQALSRDGVELRVNLGIVGGDGTPVRVLNLINYLENRGYLSYLVDAVRRERPGLI